MIAIASICLALLIALALQQRAFNVERRDWTKERQLLITRVQHPEYVIASPEHQEVPDTDLLRAEPDEIDRVGEIVNNGNGKD